LQTDAGGCISNTTVDGWRVRPMERPGYVARQDSVSRFRIKRLIIRSRFNYDRRCFKCGDVGYARIIARSYLSSLRETVPRQTWMYIVCAFYIDNPVRNSLEKSLIFTETINANVGPLNAVGVEWRYNINNKIIVSSHITVKNKIIILDSTFQQYYSNVATFQVYCRNVAKLLPHWNWKGCPPRIVGKFQVPSVG